MNTRLRPQTTAALAAFSQRRRGLLVVRGICAFLIISLLFFIVLATVDKNVLMPDELRWGISIGIYALALWMAWHTSFRKLFGASGRRDQARMLESEAPQLHEELLSAVELGDQSVEDAQLLDSAGFRSRLQDNVAGKVGKLKLENVLSMKRIGRWLGVAALAMAAIVVLCSVPGLRFLSFLGRAALPTMNLERPSDINIKILQPAYENQMVPAGESVPLIVELEGERPKKVFLETRDKEHGRFQVELRRDVGSRYTGDIQVGQEAVRFRIQAGTSLSKYYTLTSRPRPAIIQFAKTYAYPAYTAFPEKTALEDHGDLNALEGTVVKLSLTANQPIEYGELRITPREGDKITTIPLTPNGVQLTAEVTITSKLSTYEVYLKAKETGFVNEFRPQYAITALPDAAPILTLNTPDKDTLDVKRDDDIKFRGDAQDDVSLTKIERAWRINAGAWQRALVSEPKAQQTPFANEWELNASKLKVGDIVMTKFVGTDAKGNEGETDVVRLIVVAEPTREEERKWAEKQIKEADEIKAAEQATHDLAEALKQAEEPLKKEEAARTVEEQQKVARAEQALAKAEEKVEAAWEAAKETLREAPGRLQAKEQEAIAEKIQRAQNEKFEEIKERLEPKDANTAEAKNNQEKKAEQIAAQMSAELNQAAETAKSLAAEDTSKVAAEDMKHLAEQAQKAAELAKDPAKQDPAQAEKAAERLTTALARADEAEKQLESVKETTDGGQQNNATESIKRMEEAEKKIAEAKASDKPAEKLPQAVEEFKNKVEESKANTQNLAKELANKADETRRNMFNENEQLNARDAAIGEAIAAVQQAKNELDQADAEKKASNGNISPDRQQKVDLAKEKAEEALEKAAEQAASRAEISENSPDANAQETVDQSRLGRALDEMANKIEDAKSGAEAKDLAQTLEQLNKASKMLNADNQAKDLEQNLAEIARNEDSSTGKESTAEENPQNWEAAKADLATLPKALEQASAGQDAKEAANQASNSEPKNQIEQEMQKREQQPDQAQPNRATASNVAKVQDQVSAVREKLAPDVEQARNLLAQEAPTVQEMMRDLAQAATEQGKQDQALAQQADPKAAAAAAAEAKADPAAGTPEAGSPEAAAANDPKTADAATGEPKAEGAPEAAGTPPAAADAGANPAEMANATGKPEAAAGTPPASGDPAQTSQAEQSPAGAAPDAGSTPEAGTPNAEMAKADAPAANAEQVAKEAEKLVPDAQAVAEGLEKVKEALRQETAAANLQEAAQRDAAKAADTALAQLNEGAPAAAEAIEKAADSGNTAEQAKELGNAAKEQAALADALTSMAKNLDKAAEGGQQAQEAGQVADAKAAEMGVDQPLDSAYDRAAELAKMLDAAQQSQAKEALAQLEQELARNPAMQDALGQIADANAKAAASQLAEAGKQEAQLAKQTGEQAKQAGDNAQKPADANQAKQQASQQQAITGEVKEAAADLQRSARHEERLGDKAEGQELQKAGDQFQKAADAQLTQAGQALEQNQSLGQEAQTTQAANEALGQAMKESGMAAQAQPGGEQASAAGEQGQPAGEQGQPAGEQGQPGQPPAAGQPGAQGQAGQTQQGGAQPPASAMEQQQGTALAQALDQLDQALHAAADSPSAEQALANAQSALAQAMQSQASAMSQSRSQGMVPGQSQPSPPSLAQSPAPSQGQGEGKSTKDSQGNYNPAKQTTEALPDATKGTEKWGKLPTKVAEDLNEGQRQGMSAEYRSAIENYYKAIAEKARSNK